MRGDSNESDLPVPLLPVPMAGDHLSFAAFLRCRVLVVWAIVEAACLVLLSVRAYHWDVAELWRADWAQCTWRRSIIDIAAAGVLRVPIFLFLLSHSVWLLRRVTRPIAVFCTLSCGWSIFKVSQLTRTSDGVNCANVNEVESILRDDHFVLAAAVLSLCANVVEVIGLIILKRRIRKDEHMSAVLRNVEAYTSGSGSTRSVRSHHVTGSPSHMDQDMFDTGDSEEEPAPPNVRQLVDRARPEAFWLLMGCLVLLVRLPFSLSLPHFVSETISALILKDFAGAKTNIEYLVCAGVVDAVLDFWCVFLFGYTQQRLVRSLRVDLFRKLLEQDVAFFDTTASGDISSRLTSDCAEMANDLTWVFRFTIEALVRIGGIGCYMFYRSWRLASLACSVIPVVAVINRFYGAWMARNARKVQSALADANSVAQEVLSAMRTVFSFAGETHELGRYSQCVQRHYNLNVRQTVISGVYYMGCCTFLMNMCVQAALLAYGAELVMRGDVTADTLLAFMLYQGQLQEYFGNLLNSFTNLIKSAGAGAKVFELLRRTPRTRRGGQVTIPNYDGSLSFENIVFSYPTRCSHPALVDFSLRVTGGQVVAFVGPSGAGKSTIFHLLEHFYEPLSGRVCLQGINVQDLQHAWLHRVMRLVGQEPVLFSGSIESNILYGLQHDEEALATRSTEELRDSVVAAATIANAHEFVSELQDGYRTGVGERGVQLSGGQKQRVALARAMIGNPKVLLLDEATSALDSESESLVQAALEKAMKGRTVLVIAHRLSTVARADKIVFLQNGVLKESGKHQELLARPLPADGSPSYRQLLNRQQAALDA